MGLRDFLMGAQQFGQSGQEFGQTANTIRQQVAQQDLAAAMPDLLGKLRTGTPEEQAQLAGEFGAKEMMAGVKSPYSEQIGKFALPTKLQGGDVPLTAEQLAGAYSYLNPGEIASIAGLPSIKAQQAAINSSQKNTQLAGTQKRFEENQGNIKGNQSNKQSTKAFDVLNKTQDAFREKDYGILEIKQALDRNTSIDDNLVFNYVARQIGGEKGPLNEGDIQRVQGIIGIKGTAEELKAKFTGDTYNKLSQQQKDQLRKIVEGNAANFAAKKAAAFAQDLNGLYSSQEKLQDENGNPTGILASTLKDLKDQKIPVTFDEKTKRFVVEKKSSHVGKKAELINEASSLPDSPEKTALLSALNGTSKEIDDAVEKSVKEHIKKIKAGSK